MHKTSIAWTDYTVNPLRATNHTTGAVGHFCEKVSPGCQRCYASDYNSRSRPVKGTAGTVFIGTGLTYDARHREQLRFYLDASKLAAVLKHRKPCRLFWCDMTDMFAEWVSDEWLDQMFAVMALTSHITHQVLTKRPQRMRDYVVSRLGRNRSVYIEAVILNADSDQRTPDVVWPLPNVWLGVSVEDQQRVDERIPLLLQTPAAGRRFVSLEPLLAPVDLTRVLLQPARHPERGQPPVTIDALKGWHGYTGALGRTALDWVIVGGESGRGARPCETKWVLDIVRQCHAADVPCFVKQLGARPLVPACRQTHFDYRHFDRPEDKRFTEWERATTAVHRRWLAHPRDRAGADPTEWPDFLRVQEWPR